MTVSASQIAKGISSVVDMIQQFLPLIPGVGTASPIINTVIDTLQEVSPLIVDQVGTTYEGVKNIIEALSNNPGTTAQQLEKLRALDKKVDEAWDAIEDKLDPDKPGNN